MMMSPESGGVKKKRSAAAIAITAILFVLGPFLTWEETRFSRTLSEDETARYLADTQHPRKIQHALSQIADRLARNDRTASKWLPQVASLGQHPMTSVRTTAAWVMGSDPKSGLCHQALLALLNDSDVLVRRNAALSLVRFGDSSGRGELRAILTPYAIQTTVAGIVTTSVALGQKVGSGTLLARVTRAGGTVAEIRSPFAGDVSQVFVRNGLEVDANSALIAITAGPDQAWEALRALYLIGEAEDVALIERYTHSAVDPPNSLVLQAKLTTSAIRARATHSSTH